MRILVRSGNGSPEWGGRKKRQRRRVLMAVCFVVLAVAAVCTFIWVAYQRSLEPQLVWQSATMEATPVMRGAGGSSSVAA